MKILSLDEYREAGFKLRQRETAGDEASPA
jgi:hypothetical protein